MILCAFQFIILQNKLLHLVFTVYQNAYIVKLMHIGIKSVVPAICKPLDDICFANCILQSCRLIKQ